VRELHQPALPTGAQNLIWLDGEALCVTREFWEAQRGRLPDWLRLGHGPPPRRPPRGWHFVRRWQSRFWGWLWQALRGRRYASPELRQAALLYRLQRYQVPTPRLLAVGQRRRRPWQWESFLLLEDRPDAVALEGWLAGHAPPPTLRQRLYRAARRVLRKLHEAGCYLAASPPELPLGVHGQGGGQPEVVVRDLGGLALHRRKRRDLQLRDLRRLRRALLRPAAPPEAPADA
jgi:hypothetical protein